MKKRSFLTTIAILFASVTLFSACEKEKVISPDGLPSSIKDYISAHFNGHDIIKAKTEHEGTKKKYEIRLDGDIKLEFNSKGEVTEIESYQKLPDSVIPEKIRQYVEEHYPNNYIVKWELEPNKQEVKLDNGLELEFTLDGEFIRIDN